MSCAKRHSSSATAAVQAIIIPCLGSRADVARPALCPRPPAGACAQPPGRPQRDLAVQRRLWVWGDRGAVSGVGPPAGGVPTPDPPPDGLRTQVLSSARWEASPRALPACGPGGFCPETPHPRWGQEEGRGHQLPKFTQTHVHRVGDAIQPSHSLSSSSPPVARDLLWW